jgi:hypothetical protein
MKSKIITLSLLFVAFLMIGGTKVNAAATAPSCGDNFSSAVELEQGSYVGGAIEAGETCYYYMDAPNSYELKVYYELTADDFFGDVTLYDSNEDALVSSDEQAADLSWHGTQDGVSENKYYLVIDSSYAIDSYNIGYDLFDRIGTGSDAGGDFDNALEIDYLGYTGYLSSFIYGTEGGNDESDYYKLAVEKGDNVTVKVTPKGDFFAGCAIYDNNRTELFNEEGLDLTFGEIVQESFEIEQDGYIFIAVKWPYFGGLENGVEEYTLFVTNDTVNDLGSELDTDAQDTENEGEDSEDSDIRSTLIIAFLIILIVLFIGFVVFVVVMLAKRKKGKTLKSNSASAKQTSESKPSEQSKPTEVTS